MITTDDKEHFMLLEKYAADSQDTNLLGKDIDAILMGIFGEVGSIMAPAKKISRGEKLSKSTRLTFREEFGDAIWYFAILVGNTEYDFANIFSKATTCKEHEKTIAASDIPDQPIIHLPPSKKPKQMNEALLDLGQSAANLLQLRQTMDESEPLLVDFAISYLAALHVVDISFAEILYYNRKKAAGRFLKERPNTWPKFDEGFEDDERLPDHFEIEIRKRKNGKSYLKWNGVFIGSPLTDNILISDGYQFHDIFHLANAAILGWSPTFRALIKHKRKSKPSIDEAQDGGRAIVIEEGLTAWLFSRAKDLDYFEDPKSLSFDLLKTIQEFVQGYEVEACPLNQWQKAIIDGYAVFRQVRDNEGGIVIGNLKERTIEYKPLG